MFPRLNSFFPDPYSYVKCEYANVISFYMVSKQLRQECFIFMVTVKVFFRIRKCFSAMLRTVCMELEQELQENIVMRTLYRTKG